MADRLFHIHHREHKPDTIVNPGPAEWQSDCRSLDTLPSLLSPGSPAFQKPPVPLPSDVRRFQASEQRERRIVSEPAGSSGSRAFSPCEASAQKKAPSPSICRARSPVCPGLVAGSLCGCWRQSSGVSAGFVLSPRCNGRYSAGPPTRLMGLRFHQPRRWLSGRSVSRSLRQYHHRQEHSFLRRECVPETGLQFPELTHEHPKRDSFP
jgi:hypothetical protein